MDHTSTERIAAWLLNGTVQSQSGSQHGAIAGWLDRDHRPEVLYPEITGYYLTWIRFLHEIAAGDCDSRAVKANQAVQWLLSKYESEGALLTRYWLQPRKRDWRNDAVFSFDLAMIYRGLCCMEKVVSEDVRQRVLGQLIPELLRFCQPNLSLLPCVARDHRSIPPRWSTQPGPYQLKAAAALLFSSESRPAEFESSAIYTYEQWGPVAAELVDFNNLHAALYSIEGLILFAAHGWDEAWGFASRIYEKLICRLRSTRSDIVAQALRAGCILYSLGLVPASLGNRVLSRLANTLTEFIGLDGEIFYTRSSAISNQHRNVWGAIFAHQALFLYRQLHAGNGLLPEWYGMLV